VKQRLTALQFVQAAKSARRQEQRLTAVQFVQAAKSARRQDLLSTWFNAWMYRVLQSDQRTTVRAAACPCCRLLLRLSFTQ
jgi:hypothetical protein